MAFTFGTVEASWFFYCRNMMNGAAREGCRNGILQSSSGTGNATSCNAVIAGYLGNAGLVPHGTTTTGSGGNYTIGNYTVNYYDYNFDTGTNGGATAYKDPQTVVVGDGLEVQISATWATIGGFARSSHGGGYLNPTHNGGDIVATCILRKEAQ